MEKEFIPYEQALSLKELGFDEPCFATWIERDIRDGGGIVLEMWGDEDTEYTPMSMLIAPTFSQAFRWFREKHNLPSHISTYWQPDWNDYSYQYNFVEDKKKWNGIKHYKTYEEAELECLKKLIEIVKNK